MSVLSFPPLASDDYSLVTRVADCKNVPPGPDSEELAQKYVRIIMFRFRYGFELRRVHSTDVHAGSVIGLIDRQ